MRDGDGGGVEVDKKAEFQDRSGWGEESGKEMDRLDDNFGVERDGSGKRNGGKVREGGRNCRFTREGRRSGTGMVERKTRRELVMGKKSSKGKAWGCRGREKLGRWRGRRWGI